MNDTITKERILQIRELARTGRGEVPFTASEMRALCEMALTPAIEWHDASEPPTAFLTNGEGYFLVVDSDCDVAFAAYYFVNHSHHVVMCPDATAQNNFTACESCSNGEGHRITGWFEIDELDDNNLYAPLDLEGPHAIRKWALSPVNPLKEQSEVSHG